MYDQSTSPLDDEFMGVKAPMWNLNKEQPWHRMAAFGFARGASIRDVASSLGKSELAVQNLLRQPWFQSEVTKIMKEYGAKDIIEIFRNEQFNSLTTLVELRDNPEVPPAARVACARDILDRALGKPTVRVETMHMAPSEDPVAEAEKLTQELKRLRKDVNV
jgi:hypothetical protein